MMHLASLVGKGCNKVSRLFSTETSFLEKYEKIELAVSDITARIPMLVEAFGELSIKDVEESFARSAVDTAFDVAAGTIMSIAKSKAQAFGIKAYDRARVKALRNVAQKPRELQPIKGKFIRFLDDAFESSTHPALDADVTAIVKKSKNVASKITEKTSLPVSFGKTSRTKLLDFSEVTKSFVSSKKVARRTKPYKEIKKALVQKINSEKTQKLSTECPPSCPGQHEKLKEALQVAEIRSHYDNQAAEIKKIINVTEHGLQRLIERKFTPEIIKRSCSKP